jgi:hypothetical protein
MQVLYRELKLPYEVMIHKVNHSSINLVVTEVNIDGFGNIIEEFHDDDFAIKQGKLFVRNLGLAVDAGYYLSSRNFVHPSGKNIHVSNALDTDRSEENFKALLDTGE